MKKLFFAAVIAAFIWLVITAEEPECGARDRVDQNMPRSESVFGMEIGDIEYLLWEKNR